MIEIARRKRVLVGGVAAGAAAILGFAGSTASAQPLIPLPPEPNPPTVTQTVTVAAGPAAAEQAVVGAPTGAATADSTVPGGVAGPAAGTVPAASAANTAPVVAVPQTIVPATSGTMRQYFAERGVTLEPQSATGFHALNIVLPMPTGWSHVPDPNVPDAFAVIADRVGGNGLYTSNAQVVVYKLLGDFDPEQAISHGWFDSLELPAWRTTDQSLADYGGMPSSLIEGTYRENSMTMNTSRRHIIATSGPDRYLVTLSVTTSVDQAVADADATDAIATGFKVSAHEPAPPAAPAPPPPPPVPGIPGLPSLPGLQP